ncbi:TonB-dependent copper receptor [Polynucleobacter sp. MWH-Spelu-300-X4]|uniref:TonB-dependent copper receptor n=1 Tax=Polynucleobacter sp. MWH-Spelu-300-X4 TaxID=2689109 RepID=UPI001BFD4AB3|nr:TonB-dependent copper receptor [Polynucleobacter sp. MWH-Spelu-300-X4]QWD79182.1 TonB-dependent copper receptor [Polynucleobacter sp. MWH-Spelu-300-X4]
MKKIKIKPLALAALLMLANYSYAQDAGVLSDVVVTATTMSSPLIVEMDPKVPRQPLPAHDGADFLKSIPGFNIMRKAGADGEPNFRGMGGSRVNILADDQNIYGGCGQRMDAPTAYIFPEIYDKVTVIKGPQTVLYPGYGSAATVRFEKEQKIYEQLGYDVHASGLVGNFGRHDEVIDANVGDKSYFANFTSSNSSADDYKDGSGQQVHSKYHRYSAGATLGLTPDHNQRFELSAGRSDGYAAYADRSMDGTKFLRENVSGKAQIKNISDLVQKLELQLSRNTIFHTMSEAMRGNPSSYMDVTHDTNAARMVVDLSFSKNTSAKVGLDYSEAIHAGNMPGMGMPNLIDDSKFKNTGLFAEVTKQLSVDQKLIGGYRGDFWSVTDKRSSMSSDTSGQTRNDLTHSAFARLEESLQVISNSIAYVGLGRSERMPDYWELISNRRDGSTNQMSSMSANTHSALNSTKTEKTYQLDSGLIYQSSKFNLSGSLFYNKIKDFILVDSRISPDYVSGVYMTPSSRNIDAHTYGTELSAGYLLSTTLKFNSSLAYVKGRNETDGLPLAQISPLEGRLALNYDDKQYSYGALLRLVAPKNDVAVNQGNISGKDVAKSSGFSVFSLNAGYRPNKKILIAVGVDNLFDKTYAEFISRSGSVITGYTQTTRVNEPGRTTWLKATVAFD